MSRRDEFAALAEGLDQNRYYDAWLAALIVWRSIWRFSSVDWGRYRTRIWDMFSERLRVAARTAGSFASFLERCSHLFSLPQVGANDNDRKEVLRLLALPEDEQANVLSRLRDDTMVIVALLRRWRDIYREEEQNGDDND
jgi:hypothetical protein